MQLPLSDEDVKELKERRFKKADHGWLIDELVKAEDSARYYANQLAEFVAVYDQVAEPLPSRRSRSEASEPRSAVATDRPVVAVYDQVAEPLPSRRSRSEASEPRSAVATDRPARPPELEGEAAAEWDFACGLLESVGLLSSADPAVIAAYCHAWARWVNAKAMVRKLGAVVMTREATRYQNPYVAVAGEAFQHYLRLAAKLVLHAIPGD